MKQLINVSILLLSMLYFSSCEKDTGNPPVSSQVYDFSGSTITAVLVEGFCYADIQYGTSQEVELTGFKEKIEVAEVYLDGTTLIVKINKVPSSEMHVAATITIPNVALIEATDEAQVSIPNMEYIEGIDTAGNPTGITGVANPFPVWGDLTLTTSKTGQIKAYTLDLGQNKLTANVLGSGSINILERGGVSSVAGTHEVNLSGSGNFRGFGMTVNSSVVNLSGSGDATVAVNNNLEVNISGSGNVAYIGQPTIVTNITGTGELRNSN